MTSVSYKIFKEFVEKNKLTKVYKTANDCFYNGFTLVYEYINKESKVMAIEEEDINWQIESEDAENLTTLEFVSNLIKNKQ